MVEIGIRKNLRLFTVSRIQTDIATDVCAGMGALCTSSRNFLDIVLCRATSSFY